ncbi:MAG: helix-turn-helix domain-containing protein [Deltaproteobacteria bacterium]|nr:helix-turn-helix domain-containing protein [Deltaproteobacteria bacterium]
MRPAHAGFASRARRRTPGLRREEVAYLAGISPEYYTQLEQARGRHPSRTVLERLARALGLSGQERALLFEHAGIAAGYPQRPIATPGPTVLHLVSRLTDTSVTVHDAQLDVIAWNPLAAALLGDFATLAPERRNLARRFFFPRPSEPPHFLLTGGEQYGAYLVSKLRLAAVRYPEAPAVRELVNELQASRDFRELWASDAAFVPPRHLVKTTNHPRVGYLELDCMVLRVPEDDQEIVLFSAKPGSVSAQRLRALASSVPGG